MTCREAFHKQMKKDGVEIPLRWNSSVADDDEGPYWDDDFNRKWELWQQAWKAGRAEMRKQK